MPAYRVTVKRRGVSPLKLTLLVRADSHEAAGALAAAIAERESGGFFEPERVRTAARDAASLHPAAFDDRG